MRNITAAPGSTRRGWQLHAGSSSLEAVMCLAVTFPLAVSLFWLAYRAIRYVLLVIDLLVGWPYL